MKVETLAAWILHKRPIGNTSLQVTFFTRELGILHCLCKGGRNPKKQALLQAFTPLWLALDIRKERHYLRHIESTAAMLEFKGSALFAGLYINELIYYTLQAADPYPQLFNIYQESLQSLVGIADKNSLEIVLRRFEWILLQACGYGVSFTEEARLRIPIVATQYYRFVANEGFVSASTGLAGRDILAFAEGELMDLSVLKTAKVIMRKAIDHLLDGRQLKSRSLYSTQSLLGKQARRCEA